jgi:aminotransferase
MLSDRVAALEPSIIREMSARKKPTSINLSLGEPALPPNAEILDRAWARLRSGPQGYTHNAGLEELRSALAERHGFSGRTARENTIVTVGSEEGVYLAMVSTLNPGDEVLVPEPGYPAYRGIAKMVGAVPVSYPMDRSSGLAPSAESIEARLNDATKLIVLNSPSNPFGTWAERSTLERLAELVEERDLVVLTDEIYRDLYYGDAPPPTIAELTSRSIFVSGFSKSCAMTGLRLGYLIADARFVVKATLAHQLMVTCAPRLAQYAALEVLAQPEALRAHVPYYREARQTAEESAKACLPAGAEMYLGDGAFYAVIDVAQWAQGDPLALAIELAEKEDVIAVPGTAFGPSGDWFWRLSYASGADAVREGIERIGRFLGARR